MTGGTVGSMWKLMWSSLRRPMPEKMSCAFRAAGGFVLVLLV